MRLVGCGELVRWEPCSVRIQCDNAGFLQHHMLAEAAQRHILKPISILIPTRSRCRCLREIATITFFGPQKRVSQGPVISRPTRASTYLGTLWRRSWPGTTGPWVVIRTAVKGSSIGDYYLKSSVVPGQPGYSSTFNIPMEDICPRRSHQRHCLDQKQATGYRGYCLSLRV